MGQSNKDGFIVRMSCLRICVNNINKSIISMPKIEFQLCGDLRVGFTQF